VFLWLCGLLMIGAAIGILLGFPEQLVAAPSTAAQPPAAAASTVPSGDGDGGGGGAAWPHVGGSTTIEGADEIGEKYGKLAGILSLTPVHVLLLCLATMQVQSSS